MRGARVVGTLAAVIAVFLALAPAASAWEPGPVKYGVGTERNVPVTMSDGTVIRIDIYFPTSLESGEAATGSFPVVMNQTPYGKQSLSFLGQSESEEDSASGLSKPLHSLVQRGYINVIADVRGTGNSEGTFDLFEPIQRQDGAELVHWAADLPNSSGKVGLYGPSYMGINQFMTASAVGRGSPLKAIFPVIAGNDPYREIFAAGGITSFESNISLLAIYVGLPVLMMITDQSGDPAQTLKLLGPRLDAVVNNWIALALNVETGGEQRYDEEWWRERSPRYMLERVVRNRIPAFLTGGWFDVFQAGQPANYSGLQNAFRGRSVTRPMTPTQDPTPRYQLLEGPWEHVTAGEGFRLERLAHRWFDAWLKGRGTGIKTQERTLHLYDLGRDRYIDTNRYPIPAATPTTYFFGPNAGSGAPSQNDGGLSRSRPGEASGSDQILYTGLGNSCTLTTEQYSLGVGTLLLGSLGMENPCLQDDRPAQSGPGALTYTTKPFTNAKRIAGPIDATIFASSNRPEVQLHATVEDVHPDGRSRPLTAGALLGSFRALDRNQSWFDKNGRPILPYHPYTRASREPVPTGQVTRFDLEIFPTFATLRPGHRLRITLHTVDFPHVAPQGEEAANLLGGVYQVQRNAVKASFLNIPLAPASKLNRPCAICG